MPTPERILWRRYCEQHLGDRDLGFSLDVSRAGLADDDLRAMTPAIERALAAMTALEGGAIANPDEGRMVGHYWLRAPQLAPTAETQREIRDAIAAIRVFAARVHEGAAAGVGGRFEHVLHLGIGGSALGPQLVADALGGVADPVTLHFIDNTDPDGIDRVLATLDGRLDRTLVTVASKSGGTPEPRNALLETLAAYDRAGLDPSPHFVAITVPGSALDRNAEAEGWLARFPLWDWVGGRMSVTSAVGLVPAALLGIDIDEFLEGAAAMDRLTRGGDVHGNPAALLALAWHHLGDGRGTRNMVVLPYKDRLLLLGRFLQQLVMESLGKACDRGGATVHQGLTVYGNKGSTDQHAYVQQLRDGREDFFATFVRVLDDRVGDSIDVEPNVTSGDYLHGFLLGTRAALQESGRPSVMITIDRLTPRTLGALIALFERTVGLYGELIDVNAYDQPGVEAGKRAASAILSLQKEVVTHLRGVGQPRTADEIASALDRPDDAENVFVILEHLAANPARGISMTRGDRPDQTTFGG